MPGIYSLKGTVKHYAWGGTDYIPQLLQQSNKEHRPFAEYWLGTHPLGTSVVDGDEEENKELSRYTPHLSYLLKILDVKDMLSIQVHPSKAGAEEGFAAENAAGILTDAPHRNYKDDNHKPELIVALSDFWLLHGFKPEEQLVYTLLNVVELRDLLPVYNSSGYAGLYKHVMEMPQLEVNTMLQPLVDNIKETYKDNAPDKNDEDYWAAKAAATFCRDGNIDRGIFSIYLFNLIHLKKGEAIYQPSAVPHAYLEGQNVEIMANSDNVLRGGLTEKHIDVPELLKHVKCEATFPTIIEGEMKEGEKLYKVPGENASDTGFQLSVFELEANETISFAPGNTDILLLTNGMAEVDDDNTTLRLQPGNPSAVVFAGQPVYIAAAVKSTIFRATAAIHSRE